MDLPTRYFKSLPVGLDSSVSGFMVVGGGGGGHRGLHLKEEALANLWDFSSGRCCLTKAMKYNSV